MSADEVHASAPSPPVKNGRPSFWASFLGWVGLAVLGAAVFVPALGRTGPTRVGECRISQMGIEQLAGCVNAWEKDHPQTPAQTMDDLWRLCREGDEPGEDTRAFVASIEKEPDIAWMTCLRHAPAPARREGPRAQARLTVPFRFSRGPGDPPFELHSWERAPMEAYGVFAKHQEWRKIASVAIPPLLLYLLFCGGVVMVWRRWHRP